MYSNFDAENRFLQAWNAVDIERPVEYSLFTFGEPVLPYYLVCGESAGKAAVSVTQGDVRINRAMIIRPDGDNAQLKNFFENPEEEDVVQFLLARSARFSNMRLENRSGDRRLVPGTMSDTIEQLNQKLDDEDEDRVAILSAPPDLGNVAVLKYATDRVWHSAPDNLQELRERGFLP